MCDFLRAGQATKFESFKVASDVTFPSGGRTYQMGLALARCPSENSAMEELGTAAQMRSIVQRSI